MNQQEYDELRFKTIAQLMAAKLGNSNTSNMLALTDDERDTIIHVFGRFVDHIAIKCHMTEFVRAEWE